MDGPVKLIIIATVLLILGVVLPFLMVLELVTPTLFLNFLSYGCSTCGLIVGFIGIGQYIRVRK